MKTLILGGTRFLGRHLAEACVAAGHTVTLFHRGLSDPGAFPDLEHLIGDRDVNVEALRGRIWDAVFDPSAFEVAPVRAAVRAVAHPELHYTFVSSVSVYDDYSKAADEGSRVKRLEDAEEVSLSLDAYGGLKVACERAAQSELPGQVQSVRAGLILGPHDNDERFAWWLRRVARGGEVLAPGNPEAPVQFIDVRDLAAWMVRCAERRVTGVFNATGPAEPTTMRALLDTMRAVIGSDARFTWVPGELLVEHQVAPYSEMPFWLPAPLDNFHIDISRALAAGLTHRPVAETMRDSWTWLGIGWEAAASARAHKRLHIPAGLTPERETAILADAYRRGVARPDAG